MVPHRGVRPVYQKSTRLTQLTLGPCTVQMWPSNVRISGATELFGLRDFSLGAWVSGLGFRVPGFEFRVPGSTRELRLVGPLPPARSHLTEWIY